MVRILNRRDMEWLLDDPNQIRAIVAEAHAALARGETVQPVCGRVPIQDNHNLLLTMPAVLPHTDALNVKVVIVYDNNPARGCL